MKTRKIITISVIIPTLSAAFLMTGCQGNSDIDSEFNALKETSLLSNTSEKTIDSKETNKIIGDAYLPIHYMFESVGSSEYYFDGTAYKNEIEKLYNPMHIMQTLYMNDITFEQYVDYPLSYIPIKYTGKYEMLESGRLAFEYEECELYNENYEVTEIVKLSSTEPSTRKLKSIIADMNQANENNYIRDIFTHINPSHSSDIYLPLKYYYDGNKGEWKTISYEELLLPVYFKGNYIVAEQKGYTFDSIYSTHCFTLKYDDTDLTRKEETSYATICFNDDYTWCVSNAFDAINPSIGESFGTWKLIDEHILLIIPSEERFVPFYSLFYVDFDKEELFIPIYFKCNDILECTAE